MLGASCASPGSGSGRSSEDSGVSPSGIGQPTCIAIREIYACMQFHFVGGTADEDRVRSRVYLPLFASRVVVGEGPSVERDGGCLRLARL